MPSCQFTPGQVLQGNDLDIRFSTAENCPKNVYQISYTLYYVDPGPPETEFEISPPDKTPVNPSLGLYYASLMIPTNALLGTYRIRWRFQEGNGMAEQEVVQEFQVVDPKIDLVQYSAAEWGLIRVLRILLRDNCVGAEEEIIMDVGGEIMVVSMQELWEALNIQENEDDG